MQRVAQCCCKKSSISVSGSPEIHTICHCDNCKQRTGSAFGISAYFKIDNIIDRTENLNVYRLHHEVKNHDQERHFCSVCGSKLGFIRYNAKKHWKIKGHLCKNCWDNQKSQIDRK